MKSKKWIFRLIGIAILVYILFRVDFREYLQHIRTIEFRGIGYSCFIILFIYLAKSLRWNLLLRSQEIYYSFKDTFLAFTASNFVAFITPGRLGEFVKVFYLRGDLKVPVSRSISSVITDRLFDVYILLFFGFYGMIHVGLGSDILLYIVMIISLLIPLFFFHRKILDYWVGLLTRLPLLSKVLSGKQESIRQFKEGFFQLWSFNLLYAAVISVVSYLALYLAAWFIARSIHLDLRFIDVILVISIANVLSFLPITISGLGTREAVFIYYLTGMNYSAEQALVYSTLFFFCFYIVGGLYGYICFMIKPLNLRLIKKEIK